MFGCRCGGGDGACGGDGGGGDGSGGHDGGGGGGDGGGGGGCDDGGGGGWDFGREECFHGLFMGFPLEVGFFLVSRQGGLGPLCPVVVGALRTDNEVHFHQVAGLKRNCIATVFKQVCYKINK